MSFMPIQERSVTFTRRADITDPDDRFAWPDIDGTLRDLTDWTLVLHIIDPATNEIEYEKTTGVVGGDGTGKTNLAIAWEPGEMVALVGPKRWLGRVLATNGNDKAEFTLDAVGSYPVWVFDPAPTVPPTEP